MEVFVPTDQHFQIPNLWFDINIFVTFWVNTFVSMRKQLQIFFLFPFFSFFIICHFYFFNVHKFYPDNYNIWNPAVLVTDDKRFLQLEEVHVLNKMDWRTIEALTSI